MWEKNVYIMFKQPSMYDNINVTGKLIKAQECFKYCLVHFIYGDKNRKLESLFDVQY